MRAPLCPKHRRPADVPGRGVEWFQLRFRLNCGRVLVTLMARFDVHRNTGKHRETIPFTVVLHPLEIVSIPVDQLGERVGSLAADAEAIVSALDELLARAWK
jgi:hypothetical protein